MTEKKKQGTTQPGTTVTKDRKRSLLIGGIFAVFAALLVVIGILLYIVLKPKPEVSAPVVSNPTVSNVVDKDTVQTAAVDVQEKIQDGMFEMTMNTQWVFPDSSSPSSNAYVSNSEVNRRAFYFDLVLSDTSEVIYSSPILPVGTELDDITLEKKLEAGTYNAVVQYHLLDDNNVVTSSVGSTVTLFIEN